MALHLLLLPVLLHTLVVSAQDDIPFNTTGFTDIYVNPDGSSSRHHRPRGCSSKTFLSPGTSSVFTSPEFPNPYPSYRTCQYIFKTDRICNIQIECSSFQLPSFSNCCFTTNLFIKWGLRGNEQKCFCGSSGPSVVSTSFWAYAKFSSKWWNRQGFRGFNCTATSICPSSTPAPNTMTSDVPTTAAPTTAAQTTAAPTTAAPTTVAATTAAPTTAAPTTVAATTAAPTTAAATTAAPTTAAPTTVVATTAAATTIAPTTP